MVSARAIERCEPPRTPRRCRGAVLGAMYPRSANGLLSGSERGNTANRSGRSVRAVLDECPSRPWPSLNCSTPSESSTYNFSGSGLRIAYPLSLACTAQRERGLTGG